jgi:hypothetical protein
MLVKSHYITAQPNRNILALFRIQYTVVHFILKMPPLKMRIKLKRQVYDSQAVHVLQTSPKIENILNK